MDQTLFVTKVRTAAGKQAVRRLINSIRSFGGEMRGCPIWVFEADSQNASCHDLADASVRVIPLVVPDALLGYEFGDKVYACARAEEIAPFTISTLVWIDLSCLVVNPPLLYLLNERFDAAVRPVHIRNVGLLAEAPLDTYWQKVYKAVGVEDIQTTVESFVDRQHIRAYFNTHSFAVNPDQGLLRRWLACFESLVSDQAFQAGACSDELQRIFLHQAVLSALISSTINPERMRFLPPEYNYPYNLHASLHLKRRVRTLNELVTFTYEDRSIKPSDMEDIEILDPLRSWLNKYVQN